MRMHPERSLFIFGARVSIAAIDVIPSSRNAFAGKASVMSEVTVKITNSISFSVIALLIRISLISFFEEDKMLSSLFSTTAIAPRMLFIIFVYYIKRVD